METFISPKFSHLLTRFRKNHSTQYSLPHMVESWRNGLDQKKKIDAIFMDFSKAFDTIDHILLIAQLSAYGFSADSLKFIFKLSKEQKIKNGHLHSSWEKVLAVIPFSILFSISVNGLFLLPKTCDIANYADDNTLHATGDCFKSLVSGNAGDKKNLYPSSRKYIF